MAFDGLRSSPAAQTATPVTSPPESPVPTVERVIRYLAGAPLATTYAVVLLVTTLIFDRLSPEAAEGLLAASSTDVAHLVKDPSVVLFLSALWLAGGLWIADALVLLLVAVPLERRIGSLRIALVFLSGHVIATLLTELPIGAAIGAGWLTPDNAHRIDVGASYGLMAVIVAYAGGQRLVRGLTVFVLAGVLVVGIPTALNMTAYGHLLAALVGVCWWPALHQRFSWPTVGRRLRYAALRRRGSAQR